MNQQWDDTKDSEENLKWIKNWIEEGKEGWYWKLVVVVS